MTELTEEELKYASEEDWAFYNKCIDGLPKREGKKGDFYDKNEREIPWGSGPHILKHFRETIDIVKPKNILEIGLCLGAGASMWLNLTSEETKVWSVDNSDREETIEAGNILHERFKGRFGYWIINGIADYPILMWKNYFDLCWLDGAHDEQSIFWDIRVCIEMKIPYILFDDWYPRYGETQKAVAKFPELELIKDMNNLMLFKVKYDN